MKLISAALTKDQIRQSLENVKRGLPPVKDVTRRMGWKKLKAGERLQFVEKGQGLKAGETVVRICIVEVVSARRELLRRMLDDLDYGFEETKREGFEHIPGINGDPAAFVNRFCDNHTGCTAESEITRIEFKYL